MSTQFAYKTIRELKQDLVSKIDTLTEEVSRLKKDLCKRDTLVASLDRRINALHKENLYLTEIVNKQKGL
jgi:predicted nuclease with TOPRIM domain